MMAIDRSTEYLTGLVQELCRLPRETEWIEFKENKAEPEEVGEYISALANSAALIGKAYGYVVWGVQDGSHQLVGTTFRPQAKKVGNEELENWLLRLLTPKIHFRFYPFATQDREFVVLEVERAMRTPVQFHGTEYIRIGSYKKRLKDYPNRERDLWRIFDRIPFEASAAAERVTSADVINLLDFPAYFDLTGRALPENRHVLLEALQADNLLQPCSNGKWDITNLGAVLFAKRLESFGPLQRKAVRVIRYKGNSRVQTMKEQVGGRGYGAGFEGLIGYIDGLLPSTETIRQALRQQASTFPDLAIRELVANALVHQDFTISGAGPMIEIFDDRVEMTNPGIPLISAKRFVDSPPRSRNEALASLMRRMGICEERGSGWDKVVFLTELHQLPAPLTEIVGENTRIVLFAHRKLSRMDRDDRVRAVYLHACLRYVNREHMTNASVRERFGIEPQNIAIASRLIREAIEAGAIIPYDPNAAPKLKRYLPFWAAPDSQLGT